MTTICKQEFSTEDWFFGGSEDYDSQDHDSEDHDSEDHDSEDHDSEDHDSGHRTFKSENIHLKDELLNWERQESDLECSNSCERFKSQDIRLKVEFTDWDSENDFDCSSSNSSEPRLEVDLSPCTTTVTSSFSTEQYPQSPRDCPTSDDSFSSYQSSLKNFLDVSLGVIDLSPDPEIVNSPPLPEQYSNEGSGVKRKSLATLTVSEKYARIRDQNNAASRKYRQIKKDKVKLIASELDELCRINELLRKQHSSLINKVLGFRILLNQL